MAHVNSSITCKTSKVYPGNRKVLRTSICHFIPTQRSELGVNGSGKSTLLRIMAGIDKEFSGAWVA
jgi:ABC-type sulfate/molybdate transport systems ATPase subunit